MTAAETWIRDRRALVDAATEGPWSAADEHGNLPGAYPAWYVSQMVPGFETMSPKDGYVGDVADTPCPEDAALIADSRTSLPKALDALEAVLELHHRREWTRMQDFQHFGQTEFPDQCDRCHVKYPCETVAAITTALGVES